MTKTTKTTKTMDRAAMSLAGMVAVLACAAASRAQVGIVEPERPRDALRELQSEAVRSFDLDLERSYSFGWHGLSGRFSTHQTHSNRPVPAVLFGSKLSLTTISGDKSPYRDPTKLAAIYGATPPRSVDPRQVYGDQTQLHTLLLEAADQKVKRIVVLLLDGADWQVYAAAAIASGRKYDPKGYEHELDFFRFLPPGHTATRPLRSVASVITSPLGQGVAPGFDIDRGGQYPWSRQDAPYLAGNYKLGFDARVVHAVTDSASSATSIATGRKTLNGRIAMDRAGQPLQPLGRVLQQRGYVVATVTDVPFPHASPASFYASANARSEYEEIGRQMLGLGAYPGVDIVLGYGSGYVRADQTRYLALADLAAVKSSGKYEVVTGDDADPIASLVHAAQKVADARSRNVVGPTRLFGFFGDKSLDHAPYRTADGRYDPTLELAATGLPSAGERYTAATLSRMPSLQAMTLAAIEVIDATPEQPALLFVEAGLVDWALHANNLDNAVGEVLSAERSFFLLRDWITKSVGWDDAVLLVTSDHGHLLQVDIQAFEKAVTKR